MNIMCINIKKYKCHDEKNNIPHVQANDRNILNIKQRHACVFVGEFRTRLFNDRKQFSFSLKDVLTISFSKRDGLLCCFHDEE